MRRRLQIALPILVASAFAAPSAEAMPSYSSSYDGIQYTVEPIVGYEFEHLPDPTRERGELTYGARVTAGYSILAGEAEYTQGKSDEAFPDTLQEIDVVTQKIRAGVRSSYGFASMLTATLRGGAEDQLIKTTTTGLTGSTVVNSPSKIYPYLGIEVGVSLASALSLNAGILATFLDFNDLRQTEYSATVGLRITLSGSR